MKYLLFLPRLIFSIYGFLMFTGIMFLVFPLAVIASFFGKIKGGNFIYKVCGIWADVFLLLCLIFHKNIYDAPHEAGRQYVFVFNHISYFDIPVIFKSIKHQYFRILGKAEMVSVPVFGFLYRNAVVLVDRSNTEKRAQSLRQLKSILQKKISVVIAPEGTFNTTHKPLKDFYDGAFKVAIETQTPIKPLLFLDTYSRLHYKNFFSFNPGKSRTVFLQEVPVEGMTIKDVKLLKERVYALMEQKLIEHKAPWIKHPDQKSPANSFKS